MDKTNSSKEKKGDQRNSKVTLKEIRKTAQKPKDQEAYMAWFIHRRISPYITWILARTPVTPNAVTWTMFVFGIGGGVLLSLKSPLLAFLGALGFQILYLLDCVDGELARVKKKISPVGEPLDHIMHYVIETALFIGTGVGLYLRTNQALFLYIMLIINIFHIFYKSSIDILFSLYPGKKGEISQEIRKDGSLKKGVFKIFGLFTRPSTIYTILLFTLGFDLFFTDLIHPWGITAFYYIAVCAILALRTCIRIPRFYRLAKESQKKG